jgi:peptidoglycan hydrolase CwlO-like protein
VDAAAQTHSRSRRRAWIALAVVIACLLAFAVGRTPAQGDIASRIAASKGEEQRLRDAVAAESARIAATDDGLARAQARLGELQARAERRQAELRRVVTELTRARVRLTRLENKYRRAAAALAENLRADYMSERADLTNVLLNARGFSDLLERMEFLRRVAKHNAEILDDTKTTRSEVVVQARRLNTLQARNQRLTADAVKDRNAAAAVETAILNRRAELLRGRANKQAELDSVRSELAGLRDRQARALRAAQRRLTEARAAAPDVNGAIPTDPGGMAQAPAGAPEAVQLVIAAGNAISGLPYSYGGGHASFQASAYDCSGSVSYALAAAGLVSSPLDSTGFMSWGEAGPGRWITVYANAGHAYMVVAGWRFDTSALSSGGTRWTRAQRSSAGFVARHPPGL